MARTASVPRGLPPFRAQAPTPVSYPAKPGRQIVAHPANALAAAARHERTPRVPRASGRPDGTAAREARPPERAVAPRAPRASRVRRGCTSRQKESEFSHPYIFMSTRRVNLGDRATRFTASYSSVSRNSFRAVALLSLVSRELKRSVVTLVPTFCRNSLSASGFDSSSAK